MELIMLVGVPGSGKSTYSQKFVEAGYKIHSSDEIREELSRKNKINELKNKGISFDENDIVGDPNDQSVSAQTFKKMFGRTVYDLKSGKNVIYDSCNTHFPSRKRTLKNLKEALKDVDVTFSCIYFDISKEECIRRNKERQEQGSEIIDKFGNKRTVSRIVPVEVIERMYDNLQKNPPSIDDGFDKIEVIKENIAIETPCI